MSSKEVPMNDAELDELMAQLEAETGVAPALAAPPTPKAAVAVTPEPTPVDDDGAEALLADLEGALAEPDPAPVETPIVEVTPVAVAKEEPAVEDVDAALADLEAELSAAAEEPAIIAEVPMPEPALVVNTGNPLISTVGDERIPLSIISEAVVVTAPPSDMGAALKSSFAELSSNELFIDPATFRRETAVVETDLDNCMIQQNGLRSHYGALAARSEHFADKQKLKFEIIESKLYEEHRRLAIEEGEKPTEKMIEARLRQDPRWVKAKTALIDANGISSINRALVESLRDRKDMLVQLGADRRNEMQGQTRVMLQQEQTDRASTLLKEQMAPK